MEPPAELLVCIQAFFPESEWQHALDISRLESGWDAFALNDSTSERVPCGHTLGFTNGIRITAERSVGYFQINSCNFPDWEWQRLYNAYHNVGTAHMLWDNAGQRWGGPWYFSARQLGLA
jgi:hypothetical protein